MSLVLAWGAKVSPDFRARVIEIAARLQLRDPSDLMAAMAFETGETFSPSIVNPSTGATGLIQFMPSTADGLGTSTAVLAQLTAEEQLAVVERYLAPFTGRMKTLASLYMAILWPRAVDLPDSAVIFTSGQDAYLKNRGLDFNHDNAVTKAEAAAFVIAKLDRGLQPGNAVDMAAPIEDESTPARPSDIARINQQEHPMPIALGLLTQLLPSVLQLFSGRAQAQIAEKTGADPAVASQFFQGLIQQIGAAVGMQPATAGAPAVKNDQEAIQAVAALTAQAKDNADKIKALEAQSLDYLHDLTTAMKGVVDVYGEETKIETAAADAAAERAKGIEWDMARSLVFGMFVGCAILLFFVCSIASYQVYATVSHSPTTEVWAAITGLIGTVFGIAVTVFAFRFGTSKGSGAKDIIIGEMARRKASP